MISKNNKTRKTQKKIVSSGSPFVWSINPDDKNPKIYKCYTKYSLIIYIIFSFIMDILNEKMCKTMAEDLKTVFIRIITPFLI